ncbi:MAG: antibiotic resistance protein MarC, partial [Brevundimonas sp. 32-68-21]
MGAKVSVWVIDGLALSGYARTQGVRRRGRRVEFQERGEAMNAVDLGVNLFVT